MRPVDWLSDTTYRQQAIAQLDELLGNDHLPVQVSQIYGLRQIARQQPGRVKKFAECQHGRAQRRQDNTSESGKFRVQPEIDFWDLVSSLCDSTSNTKASWSVKKEGSSRLPKELREENIPAKRKGMTQEERSARKELRKRRNKWLEQWENEHIPAFFERFCTHALYRR